MVDQPFKTSGYGKLLMGAAGVRKPSIATLGESHGQYIRGAIQYSLFRHFAADVKFDTRDYASGGQMFAVGGTTTAHLLATQVPQFQARPADIAFIASGYNDAGNIPVTTIRDNVLSAANSCLAAGAMVVVICSMVSPLGNATPANQVRAQQLNYLYRRMCSDNPRLRYLPVAENVVNPQNGLWRGSVGNVAGSYSGDGTHLSGRGQRALGAAIADVLRPICSERIPRLSHPTGAYDPVNAPFQETLGDAGSIMGTAGLKNNNFDAGVAGISSASRLDFNDGGGTSTPSIITTAAPEARRKQRIVFGGAQNSTPQLVLTAQVANSNGGDATRLMDFEAVVELTNVSGLGGVSLRPSGGNDYASRMFDWTSASDLYDANTTERLFIYSTFPMPVPASNPGLTIFFHNPNGSLSGTFDISQISGALV